MKTCILLNPGARNGTRQDEVERQVESVPGFEVWPTEHANHAQELAQKAADEGFDSVVAAGGDGTVNEVVNGLMAAKPAARPRFGLLPLGTGNDLARTLKIPTDLAQALEILQRGDTRPCDVVRLRTGDTCRHFVNISAAGFSGTVNENLTSEIKRSWGPLAYLRAAVESLSELTDFAAFSLRLTFDDEETITTEGLNLVVANARFVAAGIPVAPLAEIDDGLMDILLFKPHDLAELATLTAKVLVSRHLEGEDERVFYRRASTLEVLSDPPLPLNVDGEMLEEPVGHARFELLAGALEVVVGPDTA